MHQTFTFGIHIHEYSSLYTNCTCPREVHLPSSVGPTTLEVCKYIFFFRPFVPRLWTDIRSLTGQLASSIINSIIVINVHVLHSYCIIRARAIYTHIFFFFVYSRINIQYMGAYYCLVNRLNELSAKGIIYWYVPNITMFMEYKYFISIYTCA